MPTAEIQTHIVETVATAIQSIWNQSPPQLTLEYPPQVEMGHFALGCFPLAKTLRMAPAKIAAKIADLLNEGQIPDNMIATVTAAGPYLNFRVANGVLFETVCQEVCTRDSAYGNSDTGRGQRVMVEYLAPNTNKPLHLGHLRNGALGMAVARMFGALGYEVVKANLVNDRGIHICKSMLAWQRWGRGETPAQAGLKGDHFVGRWYVRYAREARQDPGLEAEVQAMLRRWEAGDDEIVALWRTMNGWVYEGFAETYRNFGLEFDAIYYESDTYNLGKDIIQQGVGKGVFYLDEKGNTVFNLPEERFGLEKNGQAKKVTVLRPDGTSLYITQDIATTILKVRDHDLNFSIWVVGSEQEHHFRTLFQILLALGYSWAEACYHLSYGMVYLPEGKMKSREGKIVDADDLITEMRRMAVQEVRSRDTAHALSEEEIRQRAEAISMGAIKFYLLRVRPTQSIHFDPAESISFDGFTGPYCQYAYARICGILSKAEDRGGAESPVGYGALGNPEEVLLIQKLVQFPDALADGVTEYNPAKVASHLFDTAKAFSQFYNQHPVLNAESPELRAARLQLIRAAAVVLKKGLYLLGVEALENM
ncbi:MAG: arginine--tRNA ligase [Desulfobacterales bacterium]